MSIIDWRGGMLMMSIPSIAGAHLPRVQSCRCRLRVTDRRVAPSENIMLRLPERVGCCCLTVEDHRSTYKMGPTRMFWTRKCTEERPMRLSAVAIAPRNVSGLEIRLICIWIVCGYELWRIRTIHVRPRTRFTNRSYHDGGRIIVINPSKTKRKPF